MFEPGNKLAAKGKKFEQAISRALAAEDYQALRRIADKVLALAEEGERWAVELLRDTLDGKPAQALQVQDNEGRALNIGILALPVEQAGLDTTVQVQAKALPSPDLEGSKQWN